MARSSLVACVLVSLAATSLAALELCPERSSFNGCRRRGCVTVPSRRTEATVCDECGEGYRLVNKGTTRAKCECAAGYAGKGNDGICKKCPAGTDIAKGGSVVASDCLRCPQGTTPSRDGLDCTCAAGHYQAAFPQADSGYVPVTCKMCSGRTQYITGSFHTSRSCSTCPSGQVANRAHTWCVDPKDPDAVPEAKLPGLDVTLTDIQDTFRNARQKADDARIAGADSVTPGVGGALNPVNRLSDGIANLMMGGGLDTDLAAPKLPTFQELKPPKLPSLEELTKNLNLTELAKNNLTTSIADLAKTLNLTPAELANFNISNVGDLLKQVNMTNIDGKAVLGAVGKVSERLFSVLPRLPDPLYVLGLRLDPAALEDAELPAVNSVPQLFSSLLSKTMGDFDAGSDWQTLGKAAGVDD